MDYYIDNYNFKGFGIYVQESTGVVDLPKFKPPTETDWAEYNGVIIDTEKTPRTEARTIQLKCFLKADNQIDFLTKLSAFQSVFMTKGLKRLAIILTNEVGLFFDVYMSDGLQVTKRWSDSTMVGQFSVNLCEPEPIKKIIRFDSQGSASTLSFQSSEAVSIYWGDGTCQPDLYGNVSLSKTYEESGIYFAIIHGNVDNISDLTTNGDVLGLNNGGNIEIDLPEYLDEILVNVELFDIAEPGISQLTPYIKFTFNNNGESRVIRITVKIDDESLNQLKVRVKEIEDKIGNANGIAELDNNGKVPVAQLPTENPNTIVSFTDESGTYDNLPAVTDNLQAGSTLGAFFSRIKKWFASLKKVCFTGSYNDLTDKLQNATTSAAGLMSADDKKKVKQINNFNINAPASAINSNTAFGIMCYNLDLANFKVSISGDWSTGTFGQVNFGVSGRRSYGYFIEKNGICVSKSTYTINIAEYNNKLYIYAKFSSNYRSAITVLINGLFSDSDFTNLNFEILNESNFSNIKSIQITSL